MHRSVVIMIIMITLSLMQIHITIAQGQYRTTITIVNNSSQDLIDYQVKIVLDNNWDGWSYVSADGSDIYFLNENSNPLYYWIEKFEYSNQQTIIWVKVNIAASSSTNIYMYYGGDNPYSNYNDPRHIFLVFDDFSNDSTVSYIYDQYNFYKNFVGMYDISQITQSLETGLVLEFEITPDYYEAPATYGIYWYIGLTASTSATDEYNGVYPYVCMGTTTYDNSKYKELFFRSNGDGTVTNEEPVDEVTVGNRYKVSIIVTNNVQKIVVEGDISYTLQTNEPVDISALKYIAITGLEQLGEINKMCMHDSANQRLITESYRGGTLRYRAYIDNIRLRKYVSPEPTISIGSSEPVDGSSSSTTSATDVTNVTNIIEAHSVSVETTALFMMILFIVNTVLLVIRRGIIWAIIEALFPFIMYYYGFSIEIVVISLFMAVGAIIMVVRS